MRSVGERGAKPPWDAGTYDRVSDPQVAWAHAVLDRLALTGTETVLDAGCGSGRVTALLADRAARVVAVDADPAMVAHARAALGDRATVLRADLQELELDAPVDAVFSNAVFHWVPDHPRLFARLAGALRPGGRLSAQCGGRGNLARFRAVAGMPPVSPWTFATAEETEERLLAAGFAGARCWLEPVGVRPEDPRAFLRTVCLRTYEDPEATTECVLAQLGDDVELDYVRLNLEAVR
ncbi:MAG: methyltransferase domain-containing protein [Actinomycetota bacterium]|nr:methyltransferase domain-containing protein [Actinomycetota bacterium]